MILATGPITVLLLARLMKLEALTTGKILGMAIACAGVTILAIEQGLDIRRSATLLGDVITLTGTTIFSFYAVWSKQIARDYDSLTMNTISCIAGAVLFFPLAVWKGMQLNWASIPWSGWAGLFYMSAASSVAAYLYVLLGAALYGRFARHRGQLSPAGGRDHRRGPVSW